jgi:hypothetical protein
MGALSFPHFMERRFKYSIQTGKAFSNFLASGEILQGLLGGSSSSTVLLLHSSVLILFDFRSRNSVRASKPGPRVRRT